MVKLIRQFVRGDEAATMVEYGLMVALIAVVCIAVVTTMGENLSSLFGLVADKLESQSTSTSP